jgi:hypothetical protein
MHKPAGGYDEKTAWIRRQPHFLDTCPLDGGKQRAIPPTLNACRKISNLQTIRFSPRSPNHGSVEFSAQFVRDFLLSRRFTPAQNEISCFADPGVFPSGLKNSFESRCLCSLHAEWHSMCFRF